MKEDTYSFVSDIKILLLVCIQILFYYFFQDKLRFCLPFITINTITEEGNWEE